MGKAKVSKEVAEALDKQSSDEWMKQFNLIGHSKSFTDEGTPLQSIYIPEFKALEQLTPLEYARCLIVGYEVDNELQ